MSATGVVTSRPAAKRPWIRHLRGSTWTRLVDWDPDQPVTRAGRRCKNGKAAKKEEEKKKKKRESGHGSKSAKPNQKKTYDDAGCGATALADKHRELALLGHGCKVRLDELTVDTKARGDGGAVDVCGDGCV